MRSPVASNKTTRPSPLPGRRHHYIQTLLRSYRQLPHTPARCHAQDRQCAGKLFERAIPLQTVQAALLLASVRRSIRPKPDDPPLAPIRSLAYFLPVIEELLCQPLSDGYIAYLRAKVLPTRDLLTTTSRQSGSQTTPPATRKTPPQLEFKWNDYR